MGERQAYWTDPGGVLDEIKEIPYSGDSTNDRVILLGGTYHDVEVYSMQSLESADHLVVAKCFQRPGSSEMRSVTRFVGGGTGMQNALGASGGLYWQGFVAGQDRVTLGSSGSAASGTNRTAYDYLIIARRYRTIAA